MIREIQMCENSWSWHIMNVMVKVTFGRGWVTWEGVRDIREEQQYQGPRWASSSGVSLQCSWRRLWRMVKSYSAANSRPLVSLGSWHWWLLRQLKFVLLGLLRIMQKLKNAFETLNWLLVSGGKPVKLHGVLWFQLGAKANVGILTKFLNTLV